METLKQLRKERGFSQEQLAGLIGVSRRTYQRYESNEQQTDMEKLHETIDKILKLEVVDHTHGILSLEEITNTVRRVCRNYPDIECVYLFGSYARGDMTEKSDVDLFYVGENLKGLSVAGFFGDLMRNLNKEIDLLNPGNVVNDRNMIQEIFKEGIKLYQKSKKSNVNSKNK